MIKISFIMIAYTNLLLEKFVNKVCKFQYIQYIYRV